MFSTVMQVADKYKIEGESILTGYEKWVDLVSIDHEISLPMTLDKSSNSRTSGRPNLDDVRVGLLLDKAYPKLMEACCDGKNLGTVTIKSLRVNEGKLSEIVKYTLANTYISGVVSRGGNSSVGNDQTREATHPLVLVKLNYDAITVEYTETDNAGQKIGSISSKTITATAA